MFLKPNVWLSPYCTEPKFVFKNPKFVFKKPKIRRTIFVCLYPTWQQGHWYKAQDVVVFDLQIPTNSFKVGELHLLKKNVVLHVENMTNWAHCRQGNTCQDFIICNANALADNHIIFVWSKVDRHQILSIVNYKGPSDVCNVWEVVEDFQSILSLCRSQKKKMTINSTKTNYDIEIILKQIHKSA